MKKTLIIFCILILLIGGGYSISTFIRSGENSVEEEKELGMVGNKEETIGLDMGNTAPKFTLINTNNEKESLENYRGKNVILNFFATT
ncbi:AhpC/TSA family protein [Natronincola ferrireducens]|uniref:AhpC/TSA family protein n=2 Tax=Natronincola ferrireducens TaxID=393762 RepID=A0A1G8ZIB9_9FIRM|nr:AhpC/TSA family protein [Natronincola ferrireducens]